MNNFKNITLNEAKELIKDRNDFICFENEEITRIKPIFKIEDTFDGIRENFRGICFDKNGDIISLPFHKFFNLNEKEFTSTKNVKDQKLTVYEKYDGSLIHFFKTDKLIASTISSHNAYQANVALELLNEKLKYLIEDNIKQNLTPIFELVGPKNRHVVQYNENNLVYLHSRNKKDGTYLFDNRFEIKTNTYEFSFDQVIDNLERNNKEGYICKTENGLFVKIKSKWYLERAYPNNFFLKPLYYLYHLILDDTIDDIYSILDEDRKKIVDGISKEILDDILRINYNTSEILRNTKYENRKELFEKTKDQKEYQMLVMKLFDNKDLVPTIKKILKNVYKEKYKDKLGFLLNL